MFWHHGHNQQIPVYQAIYAADLNAIRLVHFPCIGLAHSPLDCA